MEVGHPRNEQASEPQLGKDVKVVLAEKIKKTKKNHLPTILLYKRVFDLHKDGILSCSCYKGVFFFDWQRPGNRKGPTTSSSEHEGPKTPDPKVNDPSCSFYTKVTQFIPPFFFGMISMTVILMFFCADIEKARSE